MYREGVSEHMISEKGGDKGSRHENISGKSVPGKGNSDAKTMRDEDAGTYGGELGELSGWLKVKGGRVMEVQQKNHLRTFRLKEFWLIEYKIGREWKSLKMSQSHLT